MQAMQQTDRECFTRQCYEGVGVPGHLCLPLVHVAHRPNLPYRLPDYLTTKYTFMLIQMQIN